MKKAVKAVLPSVVLDMLRYLRDWRGQRERLESTSVQDALSGTGQCAGAGPGGGTGMGMRAGRVSRPGSSHHGVECLKHPPNAKGQVAPVPTPVGGYRTPGGRSRGSGAVQRALQRPQHAHGICLCAGSNGPQHGCPLDARLGRWNRSLSGNQSGPAARGAAGVPLQGGASPVPGRPGSFCPMPRSMPRKMSAFDVLTIWFWLAGRFTTPRTGSGCFGA